MLAIRRRLRSHARQGASFIACGLVGAAIEFTILRILVGHYGVSPFLAYLPSAGIPAAFVFLFNKFITFRAPGGAAQQSGRFVLVYTVTFFFNYALSSTLYFLGERWLLGTTILLFFSAPRIAYLAKACAIGMTAVINYVLSHTFIFRRPLIPDAADVVVL